MMKILFVLLKIITGTFAVLSMYFASLLFLGTKEEWEHQVNQYFYEFFFARFIFVMVLGMLFFSISILLNWLFRNRIHYLKQYYFYEFIAILGLTIMFVIMAMS